MRLAVRFVAGILMLAAAISLVVAQPPASGPEGRRGPRPFDGGAAAPAVAKDAGEAKIHKVLEDIRQQQGQMLNVPDTDGRLLRFMTEAIDAKTVVEIGTSNGISAIWIGLALQKTGGKLITHEYDPKRAALARDNFKAAGMAEIITVVEGNAHETVKKLQGPIDLVFIDADKEGYADYLEKLLPLVRPGGLILAHNITPRTPNPEFLKAITTNPELETLFYTAGGGISMTLKKR